MDRGRWRRWGSGSILEKLGVRAALDPTVAHGVAIGLDGLARNEIDGRGAAMFGRRANENRVRPVKPIMLAINAVRTFIALYASCISKEFHHLLLLAK